MEERKVANNGESKEVPIKEKEVFEMEKMLSLYTRAPGRYQQKLCSKRQSYTDFVKQAANFCQKMPSFSIAANNEDYSTYGEV